MKDDPDIPGVTVQGRYLKFRHGKPTGAQMRQYLLARAKQGTPSASDAEAFSRFRNSMMPGCVWHMRAAAEIIDDMQLEIIRLGGT